MKLLKDNEIDTLMWQQLVDESPNASFFQTKACYDFYSSLNFLTPFLFAIEENNQISALVCGYIIADGNVIKQFLSRRAIVPGGVMLSDKCSAQALSLLLNSTSKVLKGKAIYIEFRNYHNYSAQKTIFSESGYSYLPHLNFQVTTPDIDTALKQLSSTKRRDVKLSQKEGAVIVDSKSGDDVKEYFTLLNDLYETRIKTPLFPLSFFEQLIQLNEAHLFCIKLNNKVIGGSLCVSLENKILYEWFVCGLDGKYKNIYPSTMATWAAIAFASENGYKYFDMMGAGKPDEGYGVRDFKSKFGGELVEHGRFLKINQKLLYSIGKKAIEILKRKK